MNREPLRVLNLEANDRDHELIRRNALSTGLSLSFQRASSRAEFEAALKLGDVDVILADHCIPGYDGMASLESALLQLPDVPYVIVSGSIGEDRAVDCIRRGASDFVHKDRLERLPAVILDITGSPDRTVRHTEVEERFREMAETIRDVFWVCAADSGKVLYVSPAYEEIWGKPPEFLFTNQGEWPESVLEEDQNVVAEARIKRSLSAPFEVEYRIKRPDMSVRWIHDRGFPVSGKVGSQARMAGVATDATERKQLESELFQAQKLELVGKLAGGIAHDFNNLLTIISGYVSMLLDKENLAPPTTEALKRVFTASRHATGLVRQLLLFSRKRHPKRDVIDLNAEVEIIVAMLRRLLSESIVIDFTPAQESPRVHADAGMLEQALVNLAVNARDAMARGRPSELQGGHAPCRQPSSPGVADPTRRTARTFPSKTPAAGYPPRCCRRSSTPSSRRRTRDGAPDSDLPRRGTLPSATTGGSMWRRGSASARLSVSFCRSPGEIEPLKEEQSERPPKPGKGTILIVEDETNVREFAAAVLQQDGYTLLQAKSGDSALEVWKWHSGRIDLLLTDVVLPGEISGPVLGELLKEEKPSLRVILTTGYNRETVAAKTSDGTLPFILNKPYTPRTLLKAVHEVLA
jgi:two-component system, cell cycle sensor histidine kinase and response regulator CckA